MDNTLSQILHACRLARDLEASLPTLANHPPVLKSSCEDIVRVLNNAIHELDTHDQQHLHFFGEVQAMDLLGGRNPFGEGNNPFAEGDEISLIGFDVPAGGSGGGGGGGGEEQVATGAAATVHQEGSSSGTSGRRPTGSTGHRASRKRREGSGMNTIRVPAVRTGNMENPPDDGYTWRKYGQKDILGSRFPRSYYRCTHKNFYGCEAKKQVQRLDQDPYTYEVTYCGDHTCHTSPTPLLLPTTTTTPQSDVPFILSDSTHQQQQQQQVQLSTSSSSSHLLLSTSIQLGSSWFNVLGSSSHSEVAAAAAAHAGPTDGSVADLADVMFNSGSSGSSSMDAIFSLRHEDSNWKDKEE